MSATRTTQNGASQGIVNVHALNGTPVQSTGVSNSQAAAVQSAVGFSTAPYKKPPRRHRDNPNIVLCAMDGCKGYPIKATDYCAGHSKSLGLVSWSNHPDKNKEPEPDATE